MPFINIEIKARTGNSTAIRQYLLANGAAFKGTDQQVDTYFNTNTGRLKLRQGTIENNLIFYTRENIAGPKQSDCQLLKVMDSDLLKTMLSAAMGVKIVVSKKREIYYIDNVKFHVDELEGLGHFVEIEACSEPGAHTKEELLEQCRFYMQAFNIQEEDLITDSYCDLLIQNGAVL